MQPETVCLTPGSLSNSYSIDQKQPPANVAISSPVVGMADAVGAGGALWEGCVMASPAAMTRAAPVAATRRCMRASLCWRRQVADGRADADEGETDPDGDDDDRGAATRLHGRRGSSGAVLGEDGGRNEPHGQQYAQRQDDQFIEIAEYRNEIGNEIDGRQRVGRDGERHRLRVPRHARVARREVERVHIALDAARPVPEALHH